MRYGTIGLSFKDCPALSSVMFGASRTGMRVAVDQFAKWLMTTTLQRDLFRINVPGQETYAPQTCMPYLMGLRLRDRRPYSTMLNTAIHFFIHMIGGAYKSVRSLNAIRSSSRRSSRDRERLSVHVCTLTDGNMRIRISFRCSGN